MSAQTKKILTTAAIVAAVIFFCYSCVTGAYNSLVSMDEQVNSQWSQVENQYQRRYDLIPNLVSTVKGYASHESEVFQQIAEARSKAGGIVNIDSSITDDPEKLAQFQKVQDTLGGALQRLLSISENYPDLKANQNFLALQDQLEGTENRIAVERKRYNDLARQYNTKIRSIPTSVFAAKWGFSAKAYFTASEKAQSAPKVEF